MLSLRLTSTILGATLLAALATSCHVLGAAGEPCGHDSECPSAQHCDQNADDGTYLTCVDGPPIGGEGEGVGEGEGDVGEGEGEGDVGEGEGEGEGEGTSGEGEGEGTSSGEGEGEGTSSGEGEGEGGGALRGDPNDLDIFVTAEPASFCDPLLPDPSTFALPPSGVSYLWTPGGGANDNCEVQYTNHTGAPVDIASVVVTGTGFTLISASPSSGTLAQNAVLDVKMHADSSTTHTGTLTITGARTLTSTLYADAQQTGAHIVIHDDNGCTNFGPVDTLGQVCAYDVVNVGDVGVNINGRNETGLGFTLGEPGISFNPPIFLGVGQSLGVVVFAGPPQGASAAGSLSWATQEGVSAGISLHASFDVPAPTLVATSECTSSSCSGYQVPLAGTDEKTITVRNDGAVTLEINALGYTTTSGPTVKADSSTPLPFYVLPGETRDFEVGIDGGGATGAFSGTFFAGNVNPGTFPFDNQGDARVVIQLAVSGTVVP